MQSALCELRKKNHVGQSHTALAGAVQEEGRTCGWSCPVFSRFGCEYLTFDQFRREHSVSSHWCRVERPVFTRFPGRTRDQRAACEKLCTSRDKFSQQNKIARAQLPVGACVFWLPYPKQTPSLSFEPFKVGGVVPAFDGAFSDWY